MKTILVPLNIDANTMALFEYARPVAAEMEASLLLLHVVRKQSYDNGTFAPDTDVHQRMVQEARMILEHLARKAVTHGIRAKVMILDGDPSKTILDTAKKMKADMILLTRACGKVDCTTEQVMDAATCPVMTMRSDQPVVRKDRETVLELAEA